MLWIVGRKDLEFAISYKWNGEAITSHEPFKVKVGPLDDDDIIKVTVNATFYDDPVPNTPPRSKP